MPSFFVFVFILQVERNENVRVYLEYFFAQLYRMRHAIHVHIYIHGT